MRIAGEGFHAWFSEGGLRNPSGEPAVFYHGAKDPESLIRFVPGGPIGARQTGDAYGVATYFTSSPSEAATYAMGGGDAPAGAVFPVVVRGRILALDAPLPAEHAQQLTQFARENLLPSDKARFTSGRSRRRFQSADDAREFFDAQRLQWERLGDGMCRALPSVEQEGDAWIIEYTNFEADVEIVTAEDARSLFRAVGWDSLAAAGFDGLSMSRDGGATWVVMHRPDGNVKSAIGNDGSFNPYDSSILHSQADEGDHETALCETGFWGRRAAGSVVLSRSTGRILVPLRSEAVLEPGTWGTWGGAVDADESPEAAALRELREEAGLPSDVDVQMKALYVFKSGDFRYHNFLAVIENEFVPELNWESESFGWFDINNLPSPLHPGLQALLDDQPSLDVIRSYVPGAAIARVGAVIADLVGVDAHQLQGGVGRLVVTTSGDVRAQVKAAREAAFDAWFAGSKVVDSEGRPLVVYHGTGVGGFTSFRAGGWFAEDEAAARQYGPVVYSAYLRIEQPATDGDLSDLFEGFKGRSFDEDEDGPSLRDLAFYDDDFHQFVKDAGHDGLVVFDDSMDIETTAYVAFDPAQIKSAIGNRGTYDPRDPDITHSLAPARAQAFHDRQSGTTYFLADRIPAGKEASVFLHEVVHRHGRSHLPEGQFDALVGQVKAWEGHAQGSTERSIHDKAAGRVAAAGVSGPVADEELFAYAVEEAVAMGVQPSAMAHEGSAEAWLSAVVQSIQRVADKLIGNSLEQLGGQDLVDLAYALAQLDRDEVSALIERELLLCGGIAYQPVASPDSEGLKADYPLASTSLMR